MFGGTTTPSGGYTIEGLPFGSFAPPNLFGDVESAPEPMTTSVVPFPMSGGCDPELGTFHTPTSIPPAPDEELVDVDDVDDADDVEEGPPEDELTLIPPMAPVPLLAGPLPLPPAPPSFVPPDPFVVPDASLRGPLAEQATMTNDERTEALRRRVACFTQLGSA
jgi:hypothetical protein